MVYFTIRLSFNEIVQLRKQVDEQLFCLIQLNENGLHAGVISDFGYSSLINHLSGESLQQMEYLDEEEFCQLRPSESSVINFFGNRKLVYE
jgi:hypothetical protein